MSAARTWSDQAFWTAWWSLMLAAPRMGVADVYGPPLYYEHLAGTGARLDGVLDETVWSRTVALTTGPYAVRAFSNGRRITVGLIANSRQDKGPATAKEHRLELYGLGEPVPATDPSTQTRYDIVPTYFMWADSAGKPFTGEARPVIRHQPVGTWEVTMNGPGTVAATWTPASQRWTVEAEWPTDVAWLLLKQGGNGGADSEAVMWLPLIEHQRPPSSWRGLNEPQIKRTLSAMTEDHAVRQAVRESPEKKLSAVVTMLEEWDRDSRMAAAKFLHFQSLVSSYGPPPEGFPLPPHPLTLDVRVIEDLRGREVPRLTKERQALKGLLTLVEAPSLQVFRARAPVDLTTEVPSPMTLLSLQGLGGEVLSSQPRAWADLSADGYSTFRADLLTYLTMWDVHHPHPASQELGKRAAVGMAYYQTLQALKKRFR